MPSFSRSSLEKLNTCDPDLIILMKEVIKYYDCVIICGTRSNEEQQALYESGASKLKAGQSKHNHKPSLAVDVMPYFKNAPNIDWSDDALPDFAFMCGFIEATAIQLNIRVRTGCKWNKLNIRDNKFRDYVHIELI